MKFRLFVVFMFLATGACASRIFIPMGATGQANHLKAYGIAYAAMQQGIKVQWLLNYKGGSFGIEADKDIENLCKKRGVSYTKMSEKQYALILNEIANPSFNGQAVALEKAPKIAVYTPLNKQPWDDAVTLALTYAEIPFEKIYVTEVLSGELDKYDWVHLFHEDFTGQYGKFYSSFQNAPWYQKEVQTMEALAAKNGFKKVSQMQLAVVKKIRAFIAAGGNMFAMCSATQTFDIALAAEGTDICDAVFDGDPVGPNVAGSLDYTNCLAFKDFRISVNPYEYAHADIDNTRYRHIPEQLDIFSLFTPPAKFDQVPAMLCQNHTTSVAGFMGQTTAFRKEVLKPGVQVMGDCMQANEARYIHGEYQDGSWTFLGGHDPEDYQHLVSDEPTDLRLHPNSPGYRLVLNNVLFPAVKKTVVPTVIMTAADHKDTLATAVENVVQVKNLKISPNPANSELIISYSAGKVEQVTILNLSGQVVISRSFNANNVSVDTKSLVPGMYLIKVNGAYAGKIVKE